MPKKRRLLYPFSLLYSAGMELRNQFYDRGIFSSVEFEVPVIAVGNLSTGGTGKSPMIEFLISLLKEDYEVATLSRGYKRSSRGFYLLEGSEAAKLVGDEPVQFKNKFPGIQVAVDEDRVHGIKRLLSQPQPPEVILLDDAFQHRRVKADLYILLTSYNGLFSEDLVLPAGNLRESRKGAKRAQIIVITKCPPNISAKEQEQIVGQLDPQEGQSVFFSSVSYSERCFSKNSAINLKELQKRSFSLVTGIANPKPLLDHLASAELKFEHLEYGDHHNFSAAEIQNLKTKSLILTTEKDFMRLKDHLAEGNLFYLPIKTELLEREKEFARLILNFLKKK